MLIDNQPYQSIWWNETQVCPQIIDQRQLPHGLVIENLYTFADCIRAITEMWVRGAPLIGVTAAYAMHLATRENTADKWHNMAQQLLNARPTAVNLRWAVEQQLGIMTTYKHNLALCIEKTLQKAKQIEQDDINTCHQIGQNGLPLLKAIAIQKNNKPINIMTHCNAGWLACTDWGTATAPVYMAAAEGIALHVWVSETRPRNQGASLTAWELGQNDIPHTLVTDNCCGHLLQNGEVDICIVGSDRTTLTGDVANKIGTYLKALAAHDNNVPFYVALPSSTIDDRITDGKSHIIIEQRDPNEVKYVQGLSNGKVSEVLIAPPNTPAINYAFDVTPARYISGLITERGICAANSTDIRKMFPELGNSYAYSK